MAFFDTYLPHRTRSDLPKIRIGNLRLEPKRRLFPLTVVFIAVSSSVADEIKVEAQIASHIRTVQVGTILGVQDFGISRPGKERVFHVFPVLVLVRDLVDRVTLMGLEWLA